MGRFIRLWSQKIQEAATLNPDTIHFGIMIKNVSGVQTALGQRKFI